MKTFQLKKEEVKRSWYLIDATDLIVGRAAVEIAKILRGKNKVTFTPHVDNGDYVIVTNCDKVRFSGNKEENKKYYRYSGYIGGLKEVSFERMIQTHPDRVIRSAVKGMLPKNKLQSQMLTRLRVFKGSEHPHVAQNVETLTISN